MNTVKIIPNPSGHSGFACLIPTGKFANRSYIGDGRSTYGTWETLEAAKAAAIKYGYAVEPAESSKTIAQFQIGKTYSCRSLCDHECVWSFQIIARTGKTIKTACGKTLRINQRLTDYNKSETVFPLGNYSMAPILTADKVAA
jgi:hypothetical protein